MANMKPKLAALAMAVTAPALAHHSSVLYDETRTVRIQASIAKVEWENPHITIWAYAPNPQKSGAQDVYGIQSGSINILTRGGWTKDTLKPGEKVTLEYFPLKDGRPGGALVRATGTDGTVHSGDPLALGFAQFKNSKSSPPPPQAAAKPGEGAK